MAKAIVASRFLAAQAIACLLGVVSLSAGVEVGIDFTIGIGKEVEPAPALASEQAGPPPWAPAHGRRAKAVYHYYPEQQVYRNEQTGVWFVYRNGEWAAVARLPATIRIGSHSAFVSLDMDTDRPYRYHHDVEKAYPANFAAQGSIRSSSPSALHGDSRRKVPPGHAKERGKKER